MSAAISSVNSASYQNYSPQQAFESNKKNDYFLKKEDNSVYAESSSQKEFKKLNQEEQSKVQQLKSRDIEVRAHEQAHLSAAGSLATSGASFTYAKSPDGASYAVGGEVSIDTTPVHGDPAATMRKADIIRRAALAPASPSSQDQQVASKATRMAEKARAELIQQRQELSKQTENSIPENAIRIDFSV